MKKKQLLYFLILSLLLVSCKTKQSLVNNEPIDKKITELIDNTQKASPVFKTANVSKMSIALKLNNKNYNVGANCKIISDSIIQVSIQPMFGVEFFKAEFFTDSIKIYDKLNRRLYATDYLTLQNKTGLNISYFDVQSLISNNYFTFGTGKIPSKNVMKTKPDENDIIFVSDKVKQESSINSQFRIEKTVINTLNEKYRLQTDYSNFETMSNVVFPQKINFQFNSNSKLYSCTFTIIKADFNSELNIAITDPTNFQRISINQLMKK